MVAHTVTGKLLIFRAGTAVIGIGPDGNPAPRGKYARNFYIFGLHEPDKILHDHVHAILMKISMVAEAEQIKLEALALHHFPVRKITDADFRKIRLAGNGTEAGELRTVETYPVIVVRVFVGECLQHFRSVIPAILRGTPQQAEPLPGAGIRERPLSMAASDGIAAERHVRFP